LATGVLAEPILAA